MTCASCIRRVSRKEKGAADGTLGRELALQSDVRCASNRSIVILLKRKGAPGHSVLGHVAQGRTGSSGDAQKRYTICAHAEGSINSCGDSGNLPNLWQARYAKVAVPLSRSDRPPSGGDKVDSVLRSVGVSMASSVPTIHTVTQREESAPTSTTGTLGQDGKQIGPVT